MHAKLSNCPQQNAVGAASFVCAKLCSVTSQQAGNSRATPVWGQSYCVTSDTPHYTLIW